MNFLREAHSAFDFAKHYPLLYKAVTDNDTPISGYTYEEIAKISFQSQQHRIHLVEFFLSRLSSSGWSGKQKAVRALLHLCKKGHYGIRQLVRRRDGDLREAASMGGPPDPVLANTPQLFFNSSIQELLSYIFDQDVIKMDEDVSRREGKNENFSSSAVGYGSSSLKQGKYEGFGSSPITKQDSIVDQVFDMVGKVVTPEARKREELANFLKDEKGNYEPFHFSNANLPFLDTAPEVVSPHRQFSGPPLYKSVVSPRAKCHVAGRVGGGWGSEDEEEENETTLISKISSSFSPNAFEETTPDHEQYIETLLESYPEWPLDYESFVLKCRESSVYNPFKLLNNLIKEMKNKIKEAEFDNCIKNSDESGDVLKGKKSKSDQNLMVMLLFLEICLNDDLLSVNLLLNNLQPFLNEISSNKFLSKSVKLKAKKIDLILRTLSSYS
ncbi:UNVERIFIED_CONTAM: hypothetical protein RMT77_002198 [Armadillidium vulgare]